MTLDLALALMAAPFVVSALLCLGACKAASDADDFADELYRREAADNIIPFERRKAL